MSIRNRWVDENPSAFPTLHCLRGEMFSGSYLFGHGLLKLVVEETLVDFPFTCLSLRRIKGRDRDKSLRTTTALLHVHYFTHSDFELHHLKVETIVCSVM